MMKSLPSHGGVDRNGDDLLDRRPGERRPPRGGRGLKWNDYADERRCVILTTAANASMEGIHDRMPVVLRREQLEPWVRDAEYATELITKTPPLLQTCEV